jgi:hypothetical protein
LFDLGQDLHRVRRTWRREPDIADQVVGIVLAREGVRVAGRGVALRVRVADHPPYQHPGALGRSQPLRPATRRNIKALIRRLARENPSPAPIAFYSSGADAA